MRLDHKRYRNVLQAETIRVATKSDRAAERAERATRIAAWTAYHAPMLERLNSIEVEVKVIGMGPAVIVKRNCVHCGAEFDAVVDKNRWARKTCGAECRAKATAESTRRRRAVAS